jgi:hypothetical protein
MDWGDHCLLECGVVYISGLNFAVLEAGEVTGKQSHIAQSRTLTGYKLFGKT